MRELFILAIHLLVAIAKLMRPGGARAVVAEPLLLKHPLLISNRSRQRAPNLSALDRTFSCNALDLERKLQAVSIYYNTSRVHQSLSGNTP